MILLNTALARHEDREKVGHTKTFTSSDCSGNSNLEIKYGVAPSDALEKILSIAQIHKKMSEVCSDDKFVDFRDMDVKVALAMAVAIVKQQAKINEEINFQSRTLRLKRFADDVNTFLQTCFPFQAFQTIDDVCTQRFDSDDGVSTELSSGGADIEIDPALVMNGLIGLSGFLWHVRQFQVWNELAELYGHHLYHAGFEQVVDFFCNDVDLYAEFPSPTIYPTTEFNVQVGGEVFLGSDFDLQFQTSVNVLFENQNEMRAFATTFKTFWMQWVHPLYADICPCPTCPGRRARSL